MVTGHDLATALAGTRYGPVEFRAAPEGIVAAFDGAAAEVTPDGGALLLTSTSPCRWPAGEDAAVADRVRFALADLAAGCPELCLVTADRAAGTVRVRLWIDEGSRAPQVAAGARTAVLLTRVAASVMAGLAQEAASAAAARRAQAEAERAADEAERALDRLMARGESGEGHPPAPPRPSAPAGQGGGTAAGVTATPLGSWCVADSAVAVRDLRSTTQIAGSMQPGATYEVRGEQHGWVHVLGHGLEGWVPASSVRRFTT